MNKCDICGEDVLPGQPRRGPPPGPGLERHWSCHVEKHGQPEPLATVSPSLLVQKVGRVRHVDAPAVRRPLVSPKGKDYNRSPNAMREWRHTGRVISEMGRRRIRIECPFCFAHFWAFVWSLSGGGKKCPNCGAMHTSVGLAIPLTGNEDLP
jgi:hypothetical protein